MKPSSIAKLAVIAGLAMAGSDYSTGQYTPWAQPPKGPRNKPGNSLAKSRAKAKARRKAQQKARRST